MDEIFTKSEIYIDHHKYQSVRYQNKVLTEIENC
jgi:hypothetical protein